MREETASSKLHCRSRVVPRPPTGAVDDGAAPPDSEDARLRFWQPAKSATDPSAKPRRETRNVSAATALLVLFRNRAPGGVLDELRGGTDDDDVGSPGAETGLEERGDIGVVLDDEDSFACEYAGA